MERAQFWKGLAVGIGVTLLAAVLIMLFSSIVMSAGRGWGCPMGGGWNDGRSPGRGMMGPGMMNDGGMMNGGMMDSTMMRDMGPIHDLLMNHNKVKRKVEDIPNGVRTVTTSEDPEVAAQIRTHVRQMKERIEEGRPIRHMDPLFREIFRHHEKVRLQIEEVPGGVRVTETSRDPQVVLLIRQHAKRAVSEFVQGGMQRAMQPTPLPPGYEPKR